MGWYPARTRRTRPAECHDGVVSRRDLTHLLNALADATQARADVGVPIDVLDEAIGRGRADMRTPLNLESLAAEGLVRQLEPGIWALTDAGVEWLREDEELSDRTR
jgi:hypothetical protein